MIEARFDDFLSDELNDPEIKAAYDALTPEYEIIAENIRHAVIHKGEELPTEVVDCIRAAAQYPLTYDEDCPPLSTEKLDVVSINAHVRKEKPHKQALFA